mgnify:CR=1 FL=1
MNTGINNHDLQELAYRIWEAEGRPLGQAERHWQMALEQAHSEEESLTGASTAGESFLGENITPETRTDLLQDERDYASQNNPLDETTQITMEAEGLNTPEQSLVSSQPSEKIGGKRKAKAKAKSPDTLADQDMSANGRAKPGKRKTSDNNILV